MNQSYFFSDCLFIHGQLLFYGQNLVNKCSLILEQKKDKMVRESVTQKFVYRHEKSIYQSLAFSV